jgi:hypothetical protein
MIFQKPEKIYTALICVAQTCTHLKLHEFKNIGNFTNGSFSLQFSTELMGFKGCFKGFYGLKEV